MPRTLGCDSEAQATVTLSPDPIAAPIRREEPKPSLTDGHAPAGSSIQFTRCSLPSANCRNAMPKCLPVLGPASSCIVTRNFPKTASGLYVFPLGVVQSCTPESSLTLVIAPSGFEK